MYSLACQYNKLTYKLPVKKASIQHHSNVNDANNNNIDTVGVRICLSWCGEEGQGKSMVHGY